MKKDILYVDFRGKKYKILPKEAVILFLVLLVIIISSLFIIDRNMPQYASWKIENKKITKKIHENRIYYREYPLLSYDFCDISIGEKKKILVIGDSYIEGDGCFNINQTWWRQLNYELNERGYYDVEVIGVGVNGASTYDELCWLKNTDMIKEINPDIVIIGYVNNDPIFNMGEEPIIKHIESKNYFEGNVISLKFSNIFPNISYKLNDMLNDQYKKNKTFNEYTGYPYSQWLRKIIDEHWGNVYNEVSVKPLGEFINSIELPIFVVPTPNSLGKEFDDYYKVLDLFEDNDIKLYNMLPNLRKRFKNTKEYKKYGKANLTNGHPGTILTSFYANYISDILENEYSQVLGTKYNQKIEYPINVNDYMPYNMSIRKVSFEDEYVEYKIKWTEESYDNMLYMPIKKDYLKLSLQYPINISKIEITGDDLDSTELYFTYRDTELDFDDTDLISKGKRKGDNCVWEFNDDSLVTSINISTNFKEKNIKGINLKIYK